MVLLTLGQPRVRRHGGVLARLKHLLLRKGVEGLQGEMQSGITAIGGQLRRVRGNLCQCTQAQCCRSGPWIGQIRHRSRSRGLCRCWPQSNGWILLCPLSKDTQCIVNDGWRANRHTAMWKVSGKRPETEIIRKKEGAKQRKRGWGAMVGKEARGKESC